MGLFKRYRKVLALVLFLHFFLEPITYAIPLLGSKTTSHAEAAVVTIESAPSTSQTSHTVAGTNVVFVSDQVGYVFIRSSDGRCRYRKTTTGGDSWDSPVTVDDQNDCVSISVWYDQWTPGDTGSYIHIATMDTSSDHLFYNRLNTADDSLLLATATSTTLGSMSVFSQATNKQSITKSTNGILYMGTDDGEETVIVSCAGNCGESTSWSAVGTPPQGNLNSWSLYLPLLGGNILLINRTTTNQMRSTVWNGSNWSAFTTIDASAVRNTAYDVGFAATLDTETGDVYLVYVADNNNFSTANHDIRTAMYSDGSWINKPDIITDDPVRGLKQIAIGRDQNNGNIHVAFSAFSTISDNTSADIYGYVSSDGMNSWGSEFGPINASSGNFYGIGMNLMSYERLYVSWYNHLTATTRAIYGETFADISPEARLTGLGDQVSLVREATDNFYIGGSFLLEAIATRTVSTVVLTEQGTIDAQNDLSNIRLLYDVDTTAPYDCADESFSGSEPQFGTPVSGGFSGADGVASFTSAPLTVGPGQSICFYVVIDVLPTATDGKTLEIVVANPKNDIVISGGVNVFPYSVVSLGGQSTVIAPDLTQFGYHWRNDDGNETDATSATGGNENVSLEALSLMEPIRLRVGVSNEGSTSSPPSSYTLEYGTPSPTCVDTNNWQTVNAPGAHWEMYDSSFVSNGDETTDILPGIGGVTNPLGSTLLTGNQGIRTTSATSATLTLEIDEFVEFEYAIIATSTAIEGQTYCFRLVGNDAPHVLYEHYPEVTVSADVIVSTFGTMRATTSIEQTNVLTEAGFAIIENSNTRNVTNITLSEQGTVFADAGISTIRLRYAFDTSAPYDCSSVSFTGAEPLFGTASSFSGESVTFSDSIAIATTSALCVMPEYDLSSTPINNQTIRFEIDNPSINVVVSGGGTVGPSSILALFGETTIESGILTQTGYHWRNDDGNEADATSATNGDENISMDDFPLNSPVRLRLGIANTSLVAGAPPTQFRLEYAPKITTCELASVWTDVDAVADDWDMFDSSFLTNSDSTTNIATSSGGVTDGAGVFITGNQGVRDTESLSSTTTIDVDEFVELEFSITSTDATAYDTTYCFRVSGNGEFLSQYNTFPEITTVPRRDFKVQRGSTQVASSSVTLLAGVHYTAPASSSRAFVRITNSHNTGAGHDTGATGAQNADDVTVHLSVSDITVGFDIVRPPSALVNTRVDWEIVEYIGKIDTDNEIIVHAVDTVTLTTQTELSGPSVPSVVNNSNVVVFVTGVSNSNPSRNYYASQITSEWNSGTQSPIFRRGHPGSPTDEVIVGYAVVEFVGLNWSIQRAEHTYDAPGVIETEPITPVNNLQRAFIHAQKRMGQITNVQHFGHEVWLSSIGAVSFRLEATASVAVEHTSVAWIIENTQTSTGAMYVERASNSTSGGSPIPYVLSQSLAQEVSTNNSSIMANTRAAGNNSVYPRPLAAFRIASSTAFELTRSNVGSNLVYRAEIISWPVSNLSIRQNYYQFYANSETITPNDPWPPGPNDLGENTIITNNSEPLGTNDVIRVRMSAQVRNANMSAGFQTFRLQYGLRATTCSAIDGASWFNVGDASSSEIWRGVSTTTTTNGESLPPNELILSVSDRAGSLVHEGESPPNPYPVFENENVEYDWYLQHNGANPQSVYCFRMVSGDTTPLAGYNFYPQIRTAGFTPLTRSWRWYGDTINETPVTFLSDENVAPIDIALDTEVMLRVTVSEIRNIEGLNSKFRLQFSEDPSFSVVTDVSATSTCGDFSYWCFTQGGGVDGAIISSSTLSDAEACVGGIGTGCGRHVTNPASASDHVHTAGSSREYTFTLRHAGARVNSVYYFRVYDVTNDEPVPSAIGTPYPSLVSQGALLTFGVGGLQAGTTTANVTTNATSNPQSIEFGDLTFGADYIAAHRLSVDTNATEGYQVLTFAKQPLSNQYGTIIESISASNSAPISWADACTINAKSCIGYHATDPVLSGGDTRFAASDTYAGLSLEPVEIMYSAVPVSESHDIVYRLRVSESQEAGEYESEIVYVVISAF